MAVLLYLIVLGSLIYAWHKSGSKRSHPLPPGPPEEPLIGHLRVIPRDHQASVFHSWARSYGDVIYLNALARSLVVLDSVKAATDLLEKRSSIYSDRNQFPLYGLLGFQPFLTILPYGPKFRLHRKIVHSYFTRKACLPWQTFQTTSARELAESLLEDSSDYSKKFSWFATAISTKIAYGFDIVSDDDEYVQLAQHSSFIMHNSGPPGGTPIDLFPVLRHFPSWFPGTFYAQFARKWKWAIKRLRDLPFEIVQQNMMEGKAGPSLLATEMAKLSKKEAVNDEDLEDLKGAAAVVYAAGSESTSSVLTVFLLAMVLYPAAQKRAQDELDRVVGRDRLPEFSDYDSMPFMECLVQEVLRWHPIAPFAIPHRCMEDNVYRGMFIPKGSMVVPNIRGMSLDETVYANPTTFQPSRFLPKPNGNGEPFFTSVFGFGRRICPGRHLASASVWIAIATILATTKISKAIDDHGNEINVIPQFTFGIVSCPEDFPCKLESRSPHTRHLLRPDQPE